MIKTIPKKKKCKKAKWFSEEALQIAEKRRDVKGKREKERYTHLNAEFQRIARRDKKAVHETWVRFLGWEVAMEKEMATHSSILARRIPWTEEPGRLQFMGSQESDVT